MYDKNHFFPPNAIKRYSLGTKNKTLKSNPDGSLTIYVQNTSPDGDKESNWLPAPADEFSMTIRTYWPRKEVLETSGRLHLQFPQDSRGKAGAIAVSCTGDPALGGFQRRVIFGRYGETPDDLVSLTRME